MGELKDRIVENLKDEIYTHLLNLKKQHSLSNLNTDFDLSEYTFDITADNNLMTIRATQWDEWNGYGNFMITKRIDTMFPIEINLEILPNGNSIDFYIIYSIITKLATNIAEIANKRRM